MSKTHNTGVRLLPFLFARTRIESSILLRFHHKTLLASQQEAWMLQSIAPATQKLSRGIRSHPPVLGPFFNLERHLAQVAWSLSALNLIYIPQSAHALDQGGVEPRQAVSPRPRTIPLRYSVGYPPVLEPDFSMQKHSVSRTGFWYCCDRDFFTFY